MPKHTVYRITGLHHDWCDHAHYEAEGSSEWVKQGGFGHTGRISADRGEHDHSAPRPHMELPMNVADRPEKPRK